MEADWQSHPDISEWIALCAPIKAMFPFVCVHVHMHICKDKDKDKDSLVMVRFTYNKH